MSIAATSLVLVVVMNNPRDLEIARLLGWYRIPLRSAPKVIAVDYLAFYQTSAFGDEKWSIRYVAPVTGHELTTRAELFRDEIDHPRAKDEYFKIQLGTVEQLEHPIPAKKWRRITFFYTTGEYLLQAQTINDLVVGSEERQTLWQALRERGEQANRYAPSEPPEVEISPETLAIFLGLHQADL
jgi:hypothetical protein